MTRQVQFLIALIGLWGGVFALGQSARPERRRVARLTHTGAAVPRAMTSDVEWPPTTAVRAEDAVVHRDLFARRAATAPAMRSTPPSATVAVVGAAPPSLRYIGFVADGGGRRVLLAGSAGVLAVGEGDFLAGGWRVEAIHAERVVLKSLTGEERAEIERTR